MTVYAVCNRLLNPETNQHCEFDGDVQTHTDGTWRCPACGRLRPRTTEGTA